MKLVSLIELIGLVSSKNEIPNKVGMYIYMLFRSNTTVV